MILITGATGNFGGSTAQYLQRKKIPFRAAARNLEALKKPFGRETELATFDWDKPETFIDTQRNNDCLHRAATGSDKRFSHKGKTIS